jgi:hypothetical protein
MKTEEMLNEVLAILRLFKDDKEKMTKIHTFFMEEIYEEEDEEFEVPEKYRDLVKKVAEAIDAGLTCYINSDTLEMEEVHPAWVGHGLYSDGFEEDEEEKFAKEFKHYDWKNKIMVESLESNESFKIMERFVGEVPEWMKKKLIGALNRKSPFANFKAIVENSEYRQMWFDFKKKELEQHVFENYIYRLENEK